ncbi:MAG: ATP-binding protein, partial [Pedobacter sp.]
MRLEDKIIKKYVNKVSCYPLAIKWLIGQIARGKDINRVIDSIHESSSDISKFCFDQIFNDLSENCHLVLFSLACLDEFPSAGVLEFIVGIEHENFEDAIEELILVSLVIPEQYKNEQQEIARKFTILSLTKSYIRHHLSNRHDLKVMIEGKINQVQNTLTVTEKAKREYRYSLNNIGAVTSEEKIAAILLQAANQKYQSSKMYEAATEDYKNAANIAPRFASIYRNWAVMESQEGHILEAEKLIEKAQSLNNIDPQIWLIWGNILKRARRFSEAYTKYEQAHRLTPTDNIILNAYGQASTTLGEYEKGYKLLSNALTKDESHSKKHEIITRSNLIENLVGWSHLLQKDRNPVEAEKKLVESLEHAEKALQLDPYDRNSQTNLYKSLLMNGHLYKKTSEIQKAYLFYSALNEMIQKESTFIDLLFNEMDKVIVGQRYMVERLM